MKLDESTFTRRDLLNALLGAGAVGLGAVAGETALAFLTGAKVPVPDKITVSGPSLETLERDRFVLAAYGPTAVMIYRLPDGELRALSAVCTHGQCNVHYRPQENDIYCGCHHGRFDADGVNVHGTPPPRPLARFHLREMADGTLIVSADPLDEAGNLIDADTPAQG